jgi:hypothetical protein
VNITICRRMKVVSVSADAARAAARRIHAGQVSRSGEPLIDHVERVANALPADVRALGFLHDVLERADGAIEELHELGLGELELAVLALLTRGPDDTYKTYVMRIARAEGTPGRIARSVKLADLNDHLRRRRAPRSPDYGWARERILASQLARGERLSGWNESAESVA